MKRQSNEEVNKYKNYGSQSENEAAPHSIGMKGTSLEEWCIRK